MERCAHRVRLPVGTVAIEVGDDGAVLEIRFCGEQAAQVRDDQGSDAAADCPCRPVARQLEEYARGERRSFDLRLAPRGTEFQRRVWRELERIPYGTTISYGELAARLGNPKAVRAVGRANGQNPLPIVIPCHRVIGADGTLTGYGGGLPLKQALLELEGVRPARQLSLM